MRKLVSFARRRFTIGGVVFAAWSLIRDLGGARISGAAGTQIQRPRPEMAPTPQQRPILRKAVAFAIKSFAASTMQPRQGDRVVITLAIENTGSAGIDVPWTIKKATMFRGSYVEAPAVFATGTKRVEPGRTEQ